MTGSSDHFFVGDRPYYGTDLFREVLKSQFLSVYLRDRERITNLDVTFKSKGVLQWKD